MTLKVENLNVSIAQQPILQDLSLDFAAGRRTAIVGPNGAGKSTLLRAVAGLNHDYTGSICLDGQEIRQLARQHMARKLAILPQGAAAPPDTTVG